MAEALTFLADDELVVDLFAGGGGASTGIEQALGRPVDIAINHAPHAIAVHTRNHPRAVHHQASVWEVRPRDVCVGRKVGLLWASPDCRHFSKAKGDVPRSDRVRSLAWVVCEWAKAVRPRVIVLENVEEFLTWGPLGPDGKPDRSRAGETFDQFVAELRALKYVVEWRIIVAADYGAPTTRKRVFLIARRDGLPIVWPEPTHGKGRAFPWRTAAECIDWSIACPSIFGRKRPLAEPTLRRIAVGLKRYVIDAAEPFLVKYHGGARGAERGQSTDEPLRTLDTSNRFALVTPFVAPVTHPRDARVHGVTEPLRTVTAAPRGELALFAPTLVQTGYGEREGQTPRALDLHRPLGTVMATGQKHALVAAFLAKHYRGVVGHGVRRPLGTVTAQDHHSLVTVRLGATRPDRRAEVRAFLVKYYGADGGPGASQQSLNDPLHTVTTRARFGLVTVEGTLYEVADIGMRMLQPDELLRAQGFPAEYALDALVGGRPITKTQRIALVGNSVCPPVARAIVAANLPARAREAA